jgi:hypothetical protein
VDERTWLEVNNAAQKLKLRRLRKARKFARGVILQLFNINPSTLPKRRARAGHYAPGLRSAIQAIGGELEITTEFPEGAFQIDRFGSKKQKLSLNLSHSLPGGPGPLQLLRAKNGNLDTTRGGWLPPEVAKG